MVVIKQRPDLVLLICMCMYMGVSSSDEVTSSPQNIFRELGINQDKFTSAVETTARTFHSRELRDAVSAGSQFLQLWMAASQSKSDSSSSEARQHGGGYQEMFDPVIGFAILGALVLAGLVAFLAYYLTNAGARKRRDLTGDVTSFSLLDPDLTAAILECMVKAETKFTCLACVAMGKDQHSCLR